MGAAVDHLRKKCVRSVCFQPVALLLDQLSGRPARSKYKAVLFSVIWGAITHYVRATRTELTEVYKKMRTLDEV